MTPAALAAEIAARAAAYAVVAVARSRAAAYLDADYLDADYLDDAAAVCRAAEVAALGILAELADEMGHRARARYCRARARRLRAARRSPAGHAD